MNSGEWVELWDDLLLRRYIIEVARSLSKKPEEQVSLIKEAWLQLGNRRPARTNEYYMHQAFKAMLRYYEIYLRDPAYEPRNPANDRAVQRVVRKTKKVFAEMKLG